MYRNFDAVIWDFGGVITSSPFEAFARFETANELPKDFIRSINATNPDTNAWALFERSEIDADAFDAAFQAEAAARGHSVRGADVLALLAGDIRPEMVAVLQRLIDEDYKIGCITNNVKTGSGAGMARSWIKPPRSRPLWNCFRMSLKVRKSVSASRIRKSTKWPAPRLMWRRSGAVFWMISASI